MSQTYRIGTLNFTGSQAILSASLNVTGSGRFTNGLTVDGPITGNGDSGDVAYYIANNRAIRGLTPGGTFYIDGDSSTGGNISYRANTHNFNGQINAGNINAGQTVNISGFNTTLSVSGSNIAAIKIQNPSATWHFESNRKATTGSLEISNNINPGPVALLISPDQNVSIGTNNTSSFKLDVSGSGRFTNGLTVSGSLFVTGSSRFVGVSNIFQSSRGSRLTINSSSAADDHIIVESWPGQTQYDNLLIYKNSTSPNGIFQIKSGLNGSADAQILYTQDGSSEYKLILGGYRGAELVSNTNMAQLSYLYGNFIIGPTSTADDALNKLQVIGRARITNGLTVTGSGIFTQFVTASAALLSGSGVQRLRVIGSGSSEPLMQVLGSQGELFTVTDSLSGSLFSVNDISGLPVIEAFSDSTVLMGTYQAPSLNTTVLLPATTVGVNAIYTVATGSYDAVYMDYVIRSGSVGRAGTFTAMWSGSSTSVADVSVTPFGDTSGFVFGANVTGSGLLISGSGTTAGWRVKTIIRSI